MKIMKIMKKLLNLFIAVTLATAVTSCGKTTKGKMDGEWKISTVEETNSNLTTNNTTTTKVNDAVITRTSTSGSTSNTSTGVVNEANWTIKKDGTWTRTISTTFSQGTAYSQKSTQTTSGSWDFLKSVSKDYKNNERVVFNILSDNNTTVTTTGNSSSTSTNSNTYLDGENSFIYIVTESKKDALTLNMDGANTATSTNPGGSSTTKTTTKSAYSLTK